MKINRVAHIAVAAEHLESAQAVFGGLLSLPVLKEDRFPSGTRMAMYEAGNLHVEVLHNPSPESLPGAFVQARGSGYFHICLEVDDLAAALAELAAKGVRVHPRSPRQGAAGHPVAFLDPDTTGGLLLELAQSAHADEQHLPNPA
jgi:methylmalonyl-CoA/ethylmalonyl-CoA epimerase